MRFITTRLILYIVSAALLLTTYLAAQVPTVTALRCNALAEPLGIDDATPRLAWQYRNPQPGAHQTAYRIEVFSSNPTNKAQTDAWDTGRIASPISSGTPYAGSPLQSSHRYFWRVTLWGADNTTTTTSATDWFETGLLQPSAWHAQWIGHESAELHRVRTAGALWISNPTAPATPGENVTHAFRLPFTPSKPVRSATLYTTGDDTVAAWVNGTAVLAPEPLPAWGRLPWMTYRTQDVTAAVHPGQNLLAIGVTHYARSRTDAASRAPMSTTLAITYTDGSIDTFISDTTHWKTAVNASGQWWTVTFDDAHWAAPERIGVDGRAPGADGEPRPWPTGPAAHLRKQIQLRKQPVSARLYATALGAYAFRINGVPVGREILAPGWTDFRERVTYQTYDVTPMLHTGANAIAATLAAGWYATPLKWEGQGNNYGATQPALKAQLRLEYSDGPRKKNIVQWIGTDSTWKAAASEIRLAEIYAGETRDQRLLAAGWDRPSFRDVTWQPATVVTPHEPEIVAQDFPPIREERALTVKIITQPKPGVYVLDFGQNMAAVPRLTVRGERGDDIRLRFAEVLNADGTLYTENLRNAKATDHFVLAGTGTEHFQPEFTFHGFQYVEITGLREPPTPQTLQAVVIHTDAPFTTQLSTGSPMVNQLYRNVLWGQRSNFVGLPTDCPQRDERLGWSADAQVFWRTASYNMELDNFTRKFARDLRGTQVGTAMYAGYAPGTNLPNDVYGAAWSDAGVIIPWTGWLQTGDPRIVDENWSGMQAYLAQIERENPNHLWQHDFGTPWGDWLTPTVTTPEDLLATAYWAYDAHLMQQMATATGRTADAAKYAAMFESVNTAFQHAYITPDNRVGAVERPGNASSTTSSMPDRFIETQTGYVLALHMNLLPEPMRASAANRLVQLIRDNRMLLGTGFLGTPYLLEVLCDTGHSDVAYQLLLNTQYPSWGYVIEHGATTTWERWNGDQMRNDPSMNSYNHYAYGAVAEWLYRYAGGIDTQANAPGFQTVLLHPNFSARLGSLNFKYDSPHGQIASAWQVHNTPGTSDDNTVTWTVTLPANTHGLLQTSRINGRDFNVDGKPLNTDERLQAKPNGEYDLPSGTYRFTATFHNSSPA